MTSFSNFGIMDYLAGFQFASTVDENYDCSTIIIENICCSLCQKQYIEMIQEEEYSTCPYCNWSLN